METMKQTRRNCKSMNLNRKVKKKHLTLDVMASILGLCSLLVGHRSYVLPRDDGQHQGQHEGQRHDEEDQHQGRCLGLLSR